MIVANATHPEWTYDQINFMEADAFVFGLHFPLHGHYDHFALTEIMGNELWKCMFRSGVISLARKFICILFSFLHGWSDCFIGWDYEFYKTDVIKWNRRSLSGAC